MKVTGIKCGLGKGHVPSYSLEGKYNFYFYGLFPHVLSMWLFMFQNPLDGSFTSSIDRLLSGVCAQGPPQVENCLVISTWGTLAIKHPLEGNTSLQLTKPVSLRRVWEWASGGSHVATTGSRFPHTVVWKILWHMAPLIIHLCNFMMQNALSLSTVLFSPS